MTSLEASLLFKMAEFDRFSGQGLEDEGASIILRIEKHPSTRPNVRQLLFCLLCLFSDCETKVQASVAILWTNELVQKLELRSLYEITHTLNEITKFVREW